KRVVILSILGHSSNERFNSLQSIIGFFLESKQCPEVIVELVAHMGISISLGSVQNMVDSLNLKARERLKSLEHCNSIYDNFDMDFASAQPTMEK
ncbi:hypothetical protein BDZ89DRAFT_903029, partial [Hymenopellis radicata]